MKNDTPSSPQLLVSVRNDREVLQAIQGGAEIIDIKETSKGSLGMADVSEIEKICFKVASENESSSSRKIQCSAALGELTDWNDSEPAPIPTLPELSFVKVGLAKLAEHSDWKSLFLDFQKRFNAQQKVSPDWVSVIYADWNCCNAPQPEEVIQFAIKSKSRVVLYDTSVKDGKTLLDHLSVEQLKSQTEKIQAAGIKVALAGSLKLESISELVTIQPDIIAIRGAACEKGDRQEGVSQKAITEFKQQLQNDFQRSYTL